MKLKKLLTKIMATTMALVSVIGVGTGCKKSNVFDNSPNTLEIFAQDSGYGVAWLEKAIEIFEANHPDINVELWTDLNSANRGLTMLEAGPSSCTTDLIFDGVFYDLQYKGERAGHGYKNALADLTDVYNEKIPGENVTMAEKMRPDLLNAFAIEEENEDGSWSDHYYFSSWASPVNSMVYNDTLLQQAGLTLPKTSDELIKLMEDFRDLNTVGGVVKKYPFACSVSVAYVGYLTTTWFAQYEGSSKYAKYLNGKNEAGEYDHRIFETKGRLYNLMALDYIQDCGNFLDGGTNKGNQLCDPGSIEYSYGQAQMELVTGDTLMIPCGDWFENEMAEMISKSKKNYTFKMMRIPVISALSDRLSYWNLSGMDYEAAYNAAKTDSTIKATLAEYDAKLSEIIAYIDGETATKPAYATSDDIAIVTDARLATSSLSDQHCVVIPAWATAMDAAKEFLKFTATDEFNKIYMEKTNGGCMPFDYDWFSDEDLTLTPFQVSKLEIWQKSKLFRTGQVNKGRWLVGLTDYVLPSTRFFQRNQDYNSPKKVWESGLMTEKELKDNLKAAGLL